METNGHLEGRDLDGYHISIDQFLFDRVENTSAEDLEPALFSLKVEMKPI
jgi:hypothetical protein